MTTATRQGFFQLGIEAQELHATIADLAEQLETAEDDAKGQIIEQLEAILMAEASNKDALFSKADAYCWVIDNLKAQADYRANQAKRLKDLAAADTKKAEQLKESMLYVLRHIEPEATKFSLCNHELTSRKSESVQIQDPDAIPEGLQRQKITVEPDKTAIKLAINAGETVPGAELVVSRAWTIR